MPGVPVRAGGVLLGCRRHGATPPPRSLCLHRPPHPASWHLGRPSPGAFTTHVARRDTPTAGSGSGSEGQGPGNAPRGPHPPPCPRQPPTPRRLQPGSRRRTREPQLGQGHRGPGSRRVPHPGEDSTLQTPSPATGPAPASSRPAHSPAPPAPLHPEQPASPPCAHPIPLSSPLAPLPPPGRRPHRSVASCVTRTHGCSLEVSGARSSAPHPHPTQGQEGNGLQGLHGLTHLPCGGDTPQGGDPGLGEQSLVPCCQPPAKDQQSCCQKSALSHWERGPPPCTPDPGAGHPLPWGPAGGHLPDLLTGVTPC